MRILAAVALLLGHCTAPAEPATSDRCPQHRAAALAAGWTEQQWKRLDTIVYRESRCNPSTHNGRGRDNSYGLLQLNMRAHAAWVGPMVDGDYSRLFDPQTNFAVALDLYHRAEDMFGCGWQPWVTRRTQGWCA